MKFVVQYPMPAELRLPATALAADVASFAQAAEAAGFDGIAFTEHPAPSHKWMQGGGHASFDPYVALAFCAGVTERLQLMTFLAVLPYRNPLLTAKAAVSLDVLSGGRLLLACGTGYLRSEFRALGVDFDERAELFDEALDVLAGVWADPEEYRLTGRHFTAAGQTLRPAPVQPRAPIWIGGNSARARERVVRHGTGWTPIFADEMLAATTGTPVMRTVADLSTRISDLRERAAAAGRDPAAIEVCVQSAVDGVVVGHGRPPFEAAAHLAWLERLWDAGATGIVVIADAPSPQENLEALARYGEEVIAVDRKG